MIYWVTSRYSDHCDRTPTAPDFVSPSKPEDSGQVPPEPQRNSKVLWKLGRSRKDSPVGVTNMQVSFPGIPVPRSGTLRCPSHRSRSLPNGLKLQSMSRSTSCRKFTPFREQVWTRPDGRERRTIFPTPVNKLPLQPYLRGVHSFAIHNVNPSPVNRAAVVDRYRYSYLVVHRTNCQENFVPRQTSCSNHADAVQSIPIEPRQPPRIRMHPVRVPLLRPVKSRDSAPAYMRVLTASVVASRPKPSHE